MKNLLKFVCIVILLLPANLYASNPTKEQVINLVQKVCSEIESGDARFVLDKITSGMPPYENVDNPNFFVLVYDERVNILAHPKKKLVGKNHSGRPDSRGKLFRNIIVRGALEKAKGWVSYVELKRGARKETRMKSYYNLCISNEKKYIVVSEMNDRLAK